MFGERFSKSRNHVWRHPLAGLGRRALLSYSRMWRCVIIAMTIVSCAAIPKAGARGELQRLVRLPQVDFPTPLNFDRTSGFTVFPLSGAAGLKAAQLLRDVKGEPEDAIQFLKAARILASGGDVPNSIRSFARAADLYARKIQSDPVNTKSLAGLAEALAALGRFGESQAVLEKAARADADPVLLDLAFGDFHKEKAWGVFAGEENRFSSGTFLEVLELMVRRGDGTRIEAARAELRHASEYFEKLAQRSERSAEVLLELACFRSFQEGLEAAFAQLLKRERSSRDLRKSLFAERAITPLLEAAQKEDAEAGTIASAICAAALSDSRGDDPTPGGWADLSKEASIKASNLCRRLQEIAESGSKQAAEAAEYLGCLQVYLMKDFSGAERNFRAALRAEPVRERSWELLVYSIFSGSDSSRLVDTCEERSLLFPNARSSILLVKAYDRQGEATKAEWAALGAATLYPNDFSVNLSLAALLLKRNNAETLLWRAGDALTKAEKQLGPSPTRDAQFAFVLLKSIYLAFSDKAEEAKALLSPFVAPGNFRIEAEEALQAIEE